MTSAIVLKLAMLFFASLNPEKHGVCEVSFVEKEPAYMNHWWMCGQCSWNNQKYLAAALTKCSEGECIWVKQTLKNADLSICEK